jgi:hypothetical protein
MILFSLVFRRDRALSFLYGSKRRGRRRAKVYGLAVQGTGI